MSEAVKHCDKTSSKSKDPYDKPYASLNPLESTIYFITYWFLVFVSLYKFYSKCQNPSKLQSNEYMTV